MLSICYMLRKPEEKKKFLQPFKSQSPRFYHSLDSIFVLSEAVNRPSINWVTAPLSGNCLGGALGAGDSFLLRWVRRSVSWPEWEERRLENDGGVHGGGVRIQKPFLQPSDGPACREDFPVVFGPAGVLEGVYSLERQLAPQSSSQRLKSGLVPSFLFFLLSRDIIKAVFETTWKIT